MPKPLILNPAQAEAVYSAMCALNNVGGLVRIDFERGDLTVQEHHTSGKVTVVRLVDTAARQEFESYASQAAFAVAYRVDASASLLADALAEPAAPIPAGFLDDDGSEAHPDNHGPLSNLPHDA